ncbi:DUF2927 domain-containing protein [Roseivivax marinus]|uniref:DUF2927 domain-containing protein n=1 Tax=Roseivivax marinus TaxID=1379903 RepID=UPI000B86A815|nr:DUF2927 domain-containing protein [Roseivivax marinus]
MPMELRRSVRLHGSMMEKTMIDVLGPRLAAALVTLALLTGPTTADPQTTGDLLEDARIIVTSDKDDVRLWAHPPRILVLHNEPAVVEVMRDIYQEVEEAVSSPFGDRFLGELIFASVPEGLGDGDAPMKIRMAKGGPSGAEVRVALSPEMDLRTDIVVVVADRPTVAMLNGLWGVERKYTRRQMERARGGCFYEANSLNGVKFGAYIAIATPVGRDHLRLCVREEFLQVLGPLQDADGSPFFSFNNHLEASAEQESNDIALIRALYESGAGPGGSPDVVIDYLETLTAQ